MVIHVRLNTATQTYFKGTLVQAKRYEPFERMRQRQKAELVIQCQKMLDILSSSFVFNYMNGEMRCGSAVRILGSSSRDLSYLCDWTSYRFFRELFRCPIGDIRLTSARVNELPVPNIIQLKASGQLSEDRQ